MNRTAGSLMSDNPDTWREGWYGWKPVSPAVQQEETHGGAPENGRADADHEECGCELAEELADERHMHNALRRASARLLAAIDDDPDDNRQMQTRAAGEVTAALSASRSDASGTAGSAVPGGGQPLGAAIIDEFRADLEYLAVGQPQQEEEAPDSDWQPKAPWVGRTTAEDLYAAKSADGAPDGAAQRCPGCGGDAGDNWFDRSLCPEPCGGMHTRCVECGVALDECPWENRAADVVAQLLDRAEALIMEDTGSVVCWHEFTVDEALRSDCVQCCVMLARIALGNTASRSDASETAGPAVPQCDGNYEVCSEWPDCECIDGPPPAVPGGGQPQQGEEAPSEAPAAQNAALRADAEAKLELARKELAVIAGLECEHGYSEDERDNCACLGCQAHHAATAGLIMTGPNATAPAALAGADSGGPTTTPSAPLVGEIRYVLERDAREVDRLTEGMNEDVAAKYREAPAKALAALDALVGALERAEQRAADIRAERDRVFERASAADRRRYDAELRAERAEEETRQYDNGLAVLEASTMKDEDAEGWITVYSWTTGPYHRILGFRPKILALAAEFQKAVARAECAEQRVKAEAAEKWSARGRAQKWESAAFDAEERAGRAEQALAEILDVPGNATVTNCHSIARAVLAGSPDTQNPCSEASLEASTNTVDAPDGAKHSVQRDVADFHRALEIPIGTKPGIHRPQLRADLIREEAAETVAAIERGDLIEAIDGFCDLLCVVYGAAEEFGINLAPFWDEVHRTNMAKRGGPVREDGKRLKPEGWTPPDIAGVLARVATAPRSGASEAAAGSPDRPPPDSQPEMAAPGETSGAPDGEESRGV